MVADVCHWLSTVLAVMCPRCALADSVIGLAKGGSRTLKVSVAEGNSNVVSATATDIYRWTEV
jgi:hypothetical protein